MPNFKPFFRLQRRPAAALGVPAQAGASASAATMELARQFGRNHVALNDSVLGTLMDTAIQETDADARRLRGEELAAAAEYQHRLRLQGSFNLQDPMQPARATQGETP